MGRAGGGVPVGFETLGGHKGVDAWRAVGVEKWLGFPLGEPN